MNTYCPSVRELGTLKKEALITCAWYVANHVHLKGVCRGVYLCVGFPNPTYSWRTSFPKKSK